MVKTPPQGPRRGHPPRLRQKRRMRENCRNIKKVQTTAAGPRRQRGASPHTSQAAPLKHAQKNAAHGHCQKHNIHQGTDRSVECAKTAEKVQTTASSTRRQRGASSHTSQAAEMQTTVTARSRRKQPATHLKEPQPKHPGEPRKSSAAQATHGIACKRAAEPPKRHGSRRKPPAHQKQPDGNFPPTGPAKRCNEHQRQH